VAAPTEDRLNGAHPPTVCSAQSPRAEPHRQAGAEPRAGTRLAGRADRMSAACGGENPVVAEKDPWQAGSPPESPRALASWWRPQLAVNPLDRLGVDRSLRRSQLCQSIRTKCAHQALGAGWIDGFCDRTASAGPGFDALSFTVDALLGRAPVEHSARIDPVFLQASRADSDTLETVRRVTAAILADAKVSR